MKITIKRPVEIEVRYLRMILPVKYDEEDVPNDLPLRRGNYWEAVVDIDDGRIEGWPKVTAFDLSMKVTDAGVYILFDDQRREIARVEDYVPDLVPGEYGDYVNLKIDQNGFITNWPEKKTFSEFFRKQND